MPSPLRNELKLEVTGAANLIVVTVNENPLLMTFREAGTVPPGLSVDITSPTPNQAVPRGTVHVIATVIGAAAPLVTAWLTRVTSTPATIPYDSVAHAASSTTWDFTWNNVSVPGTYVATVQATAGGESASQSVTFRIT